MSLRGTVFTKYMAAPLALIFVSYTALCQDPVKPPAKVPLPAKKPAIPAKGGTTPPTKTGATTGTKGPTTSGSSGPTTSGSKGVTTENRPTNTGGTHPLTSPVVKQPGPSKQPTQPIARSHTVTQTRTGAIVEKRPGGAVASLKDPKRGMEVHHTLSGNRRVEVERPDHSRIVAERGGRGYVQRPYMYNGHEYARRSYYYNGRYYNNYYGRYYYHGVYVNPYYPAYYYPPAYYGWAYNPWAGPAVPYAWGWGGNPWYGYYGSYFTPYPAYAGPAFWLTDYVIASSLQSAYQARQTQDAALSNPAPLSPATKQLIADEVKDQISLENNEAQNTAKPNAEPDPASSSIQRALTDNKKLHVFVAGHDLDVVDAGGVECALSEGDALQLTGPAEPEAQAASLSVLASKGGQECQSGKIVSVSIVDLQDMQNHMRETIDLGLKDLQAKQGTGGLPAAPASTKGKPVESPMALSAPPPPPENEVVAQINQQSQEADKAEKEALVGGPAGPGQ